MTAGDKRGSSTQHSLQDAWRQAGSKEGIQDVQAASPSYLTPYYGIAGDTVDSSISPAGTTPSLVRSSGVTPQACTPCEVAISDQFDEIWVGESQDLEQYTFVQPDETLTGDFQFFEQDGTKDIDVMLNLWPTTSELDWGF
jgi:hypothetical protein